MNNFCSLIKTYMHCTYNNSDSPYLKWPEAPGKTTMCSVSSFWIPSPVLIQTCRCINTSGNLLEWWFKRNISTSNYLQEIDKYYLVKTIYVSKRITSQKLVRCLSKKTGTWLCIRRRCQQKYSHYKLEKNTQLQSDKCKIRRYKLLFLLGEVERIKWSESYHERC